MENYLNRHFKNENTVAVQMAIPSTVHNRAALLALEESSRLSLRVTKRDKILEAIVRGLKILEDEARANAAKEYEIKK